MFGLFSRKSKKEAETLTQPGYLEIVNKWDDFLDKMNTRFQESLVNAEEALLDNLEESNYDLQPTIRAWSGIKAQLDKLSDKVEDTFENTVTPQMLEYIVLP